MWCFFHILKDLKTVRMWKTWTFSEISWTKKNVSARKILSNSQKINVVFLEIDKEKRRISLSYKQTLPNPWKEFSQKNKELLEANFECLIC